jgi:MoaA/NifB/PqqE/SkfB family radical SAM enzyme
MEKSKSIKLANQNIQLGSSHIFKDSQKIPFDRISYMIEFMSHNLAYKEYIKKQNHLDENQIILEKFKNKYFNYRANWLETPKRYAYDSLLNEKIPNPLCVDIEIASICDLACPHCFREYIMTPDKIMNDDLYKKIINSIAKLDVPSIKLNWRGEPLLHPKIVDFIRYAKENGILEVIINTNATKLDVEMSKKLIDAGLDQIIFSFDGGNKKTYDKMRPGRFENNNFEKIYSNIKNFFSVRNELNSKFPTSKIQMVLTSDTRNEIEDFYSLFNPYVDDVTVLQYNERGGNISDLSEINKNKINKYLLKNKLDENTPYMVTANDEIFISGERLPCAQIFQRLMVTYDGKVGMCCHDWGAQHCIGYLSERAFDEEKVIKDLEKSILNNKKGFELLKYAKKPKVYNIPEKRIDEIIDIWNGEELNKVRKLHAKQRLNEIEVCKGCTFKDTYAWTKIT